MKKTVLVSLLFLFITGLLSPKGSMDSKSDEVFQPVDVHVAVFAGPSGVGMAKLLSKSPKLNTSSNIQFEIVGSVDVLLPKLISGDVDIGILPPNVAAKLYNKNPKSIMCTAIVGNGMLSVVTKDTSITSFSDLTGKTLYVAGQGSTPDYTLKTLLKYNKIENSVETNFSLPYSEIPAALVAGKIEYALVPEPFATVAVLTSAQSDKPVKRVLSISDEWKKAGFGDNFPMTLCVVRTEFAKNNPEIVREFMTAYKNAIEWTVANPKEASVLVESSGLGLKAVIAEKAIPSSSYIFIPAEEAAQPINTLLSIFLEYAPESIGGKLPDEGFYFK